MYCFVFFSSTAVLVNKNITHAMPALR